MLAAAVWLGLTAINHALTPQEPATKPQPFLTAHDTKLYFGDKEYRAIGVNTPYISRLYTGQMEQDAARTEKDRQEVRAMIEDASRSGIAFFRFFGYPITPKEIAWYLKNKEEYWRRMDELFALCHKCNIKLNPSLGMFPWTHYRPYTGENIPAILDPNSQTHQLIYAYVTEMVTRYKDNSDILMWDITNELFLKADHSPTGNPKDRMSFAQLQQLYREATAHIKRLDPNHLITGGDACVRPESMSLRMGTKLKMDTLRDHLSNLLASQPVPLDVFSLHNYGPGGPTEKTKYRNKDAEGYQLYPGNLRVDDYQAAEVRALHAANRPVLIGELGQHYPYLNEDSSAGWVISAIDQLEAKDVSLICLWVWHFPEQPEYTFDSQSHPELVARAAAFNRKYNALLLDPM